MIGFTMMLPIGEMNHQLFHLAIRWVYDPMIFWCDPWVCLNITGSSSFSPLNTSILWHTSFWDMSKHHSDDHISSHVPCNNIRTKRLALNIHTLLMIPYDSIWFADTTSDCHTALFWYCFWGLWPPWSWWFSSSRSTWAPWSCEPKALNILWLSCCYPKP